SGRRSGIPPPTAPDDLRLREARQLAPMRPCLSAGSEPVFNVPRVITATLALLIAVHAVRELALSDDGNIEFLLLFAFIPVRYDPSLLTAGAMPGGFGAQVWTFVTYALIHGEGLFHISFNGVWLLAFGSPIARRFGTPRFMAFFIATAAAG